MKRPLLSVIFALGLMLPATMTLAHHGWSWTTGGNIDLIGIIKTARLGNPHGVLRIDVEGQVWTAEVGQPWRNQRAGLKDDDLAEGVEIRVIGEPSADIADKRVKVERLFLREREYALYCQGRREIRPKGGAKHCHRGRGGEVVRGGRDEAGALGAGNAGRA